MSAEVLRRASALMRERAEAAPWPFAYHQSGGWNPVDMVGFLDAYCQRSITFDAAGEAADVADQYMAWHPAVALAVADWLDLTAETPAFRAFADGRKSHVAKNITAALAVARAYLGESP